MWSEVLQLQPHEPRALEYLRSAGHVDDHIPAGGSGPLRAQLEQLLAERKYEEALDFLHTARWATPDAPDISRGIHLLKERLLRRYLAKVGNLDAVPRVTAAADLAELTDEERTVLRLVDGISTFGDIAHESRLGRFETYRTLSRFVTEHIVVAEPVSGDASTAMAVRATTAPPPPRRRRGVLLATEIAVAVGVLGGGAYYLLTKSTDGRHPAPAAAVSAPEPARAPEPEPIAAPPPQASVAPDAAAVEVAAARDAHAVELALLPDAHSELVLEIHPEPAPRPAPPAHPRPAPRREEKRAATAKPTRTLAPATPAAPPPAPEAAPAAAPEEPEHEPVAEKPTTTTPSPTETPAAPAAPAPAPTSFDARAATSDLAVVGPLARGVVERAVSRVVPAFRDCYAPAARAAKKNAAGAVRVVLTIDETGRAQDVSASSEPVPGVASCVQDAARQIRTQVAPDVGTARVVFTVTYTPGGP